MRIEQSVVPAGSRITPGAADGEIEHLRHASEAAAAELETIAQRVQADGHADEAAIFLAQASIARDPTLVAAATKRINEAAEDAIVDAATVAFDWSSAQAVKYGANDPDLKYFRVGPNLGF